MTFTTSFNELYDDRQERLPRLSGADILRSAGLLALGRAARESFTAADKGRLYMHPMRRWYQSKVVIGAVSLLLLCISAGVAASIQFAGGAPSSSSSSSSPATVVGAPAPLSAVALLSGYSVASWTPPVAAAFAAALAPLVGVDASAVSITSVSAAPSARRLLLQSRALLVGFSVSFPASPSAAASRSSAAAALASLSQASPGAASFLASFTASCSEAHITAPSDLYLLPVSTGGSQPAAASSPPPSGGAAAATPSPPPVASASAAALSSPDGAAAAQAQQQGGALSVATPASPDAGAQQLGSGAGAGTAAREAASAAVAASPPLNSPPLLSSPPHALNPYVPWPPPPEASPPAPGAPTSSETDGEAEQGAPSDSTVDDV